MSTNSFDSLSSQYLELLDISKYNIPIENLPSVPIKNGILTRCVLVKGLAKLEIWKNPEVQFSFTELTLNDLNLVDISLIGQYTFLKRLILSKNLIKDLSMLGNLKNLEFLDVSNNCIERVLDFTTEIPLKLYYADFSYNKVKCISDLEDFWHLIHLDVSHNTISCISGIFKLKFLKFLDLSNNYIKQVNFDELPENLVEIRLSNNQLTRVKLYKDLSNSCEILNLSNNRLTSLSFLKHIKKLTTLCIDNNLITDVTELEYLRQLENLEFLNLEHNEVLKFNIHHQILDIDTESSSSIDSKIYNVENGVKLNVAELHAIQTAKKHAVRNTVLEHLSGRHISQSVLNSREVCIVLLVGPTKTKKKYFLEKIAEIDQRFYRAQIHTTKNSSPDLANGIYKTVSPDIFNEMTTDGKFLFTFQYLGHFYGLSDEEIEKCANENKILIGFANLEGALCLKMRGFNVTLILVLPDNKIAYEDALRLSLRTKKQYVDKLKLPITSELSHHMSSISNQSILSKSNSLLTKKEDLYSTDSKMSFNLDNSKLDSFVVHQSLIRNENENLHDELGELESLRQNLFLSEYDSNITEDDSWTNDNSFSDLISECLENINICNDLFEKTTDIFYSRIYNDDNEKALNEISTIMNDILWKYENSDVTIDHILNTEFMSEHIQRRTDQLLSMIR